MGGRRGRHPAPQVPSTTRCCWPSESWSFAFRSEAPSPPSGVEEVPRRPRRRGSLTRRVAAAAAAVHVEAARRLVHTSCRILTRWGARMSRTHAHVCVCVCVCCVCVCVCVCVYITCLLVSCWFLVFGSFFIRREWSSRLYYEYLRSTLRGVCACVCA